MNPDRIAKGMYWDRALSVVEGCTPISPACLNCWAASQSYIRSHQKNPKVRARHEGLTEIVHSRPTFNGKIRLMWKDIEKPVRVKKPTVWAIWNDLYHPDVPAHFITRTYSMMSACPQHTFLVCTKRPKRIVSVLYGEEGGFYLGGGDYLPNVYHLTTTENQEWADIRIPQLLELKKESRSWRLAVSIEPMLDSIKLNLRCPSCGYGPIDQNINLDHHLCNGLGWIDLVIAGCETGSRCRSSETAWFRLLRNQCVEAGTLFFLKQMEVYNFLGRGKVVKMPELDEAVHNQLPWEAK